MSLDPSGLMGFKQRIESSYGEMSVETLDRFSAEARIVADWIGPRGKGARIESLAVYEGALIAKGLRGKEMERAMVKQFGPTKFAFDGISTSFAGRYKGAAAWANIGGHEILVDYGFSGQTRVMAHEGAHGALRKTDSHDLAANGYGAVGIADALRNGRQWQNADNFVCVIMGC